MKHGWMFAVMVFGCSHDHEQRGPDAPPPDTEFAEAPHGNVPQLMDLGGGVLVAPKVQPIFFMGDTQMQGDIERFLAELSTSSYWTAVVGEYGVGQLTVLPTIVTMDTPPTQESDLTTWLKTNLDGMHAGWPTLDSDTVYSVFTPDGVVVHSPYGDSCDAYGAYHDELTSADGKSILYALMPRCHYGDTPLLDELTESFSHELAEAATDPRVETKPAFGDADPEHYIWAFTPGAENGDYCEYLESAYKPLVGTFMVQRQWSNAAAKAGHDPCVPAPSEPYVGAAPMLSEDAPLDGFNGPVTTKAVKVPINTSKTIDIALYTDAPTDAYSVTAIDVAEFWGSSPELMFQWDRMTGNNGDTLHLTITRKTNGDIGGSEFVIVTKRADGTDVSMWWAFASN